MTFDHRHYVASLRWNSAEREALADLHAKDRETLTPLIELVPRYFRNPDGKVGDIRKAAKKIAREIESVWGHARVFIDLRNIWNAGIDSIDTDPSIIELLAEEFRCSRPLFKDPSLLVPVVTTDSDERIISAVRAIAEEDNVGACVRLPINDLNDSSIESNLERLVSSLKLDVLDVDLVLDLGFTNGSPLSLEDICTSIPALDKWKTFTLLSGAFPRDLQELEKDEVHHLPRTDWLYYAEQIQSLDKSIRIPTYGDYTVQHALFREPPKGCNPSASIRYTSEDSWVVLRGHGLTHKGSVGNVQYPAEAQLLCGMDEYCGENFSTGDRYIRESWNHDAGPGTPRTWIRAGINHHLAYATRQVAKTHRGLPTNRYATVL